MAENNRESGDTTASLLHSNSRQTPETKRKPKRVRCIIITLSTTVLLVLSLTLFTCFADSTKPVRCFFSNSLSLDFAECQTLDLLHGLSDASSLISGFNHTNVYVARNSTGGNGVNLAKFSKQDLKYIELAESAWNIAWEIFQDKKGWKLDQGKNLETGRVYSKSYEGMGRVTKLQGYVDMSPEELLRILVLEPENLASWVPNLDIYEVIHTITDNIDIIYTLTPPIAGGVISVRDYVNLRHWKSRGNTTLCGEVGTIHPDRPPTDNAVRVNYEISGVIFRPVKGEPNKCLMERTLCADIGGWIPKWIVDQQMASTLLEFLQSVRDKAKQLTDKP